MSLAIILAVAILAAALVTAGLWVAWLIPVTQRAKRTLGLDAGAGFIAPDFDAPLPDHVLADFEGRGRLAGR
jgi:hypothetical protein